jgi:hypothetical protein
MHKYVLTIMLLPLLFFPACGSGLVHFFDHENSGSIADFWSLPVNLNDNISPNGQDAGDAQVAMDNNGNTIIVWRQFDGSNDQIYKSEYRGGVWTHPANLADHISFGGTIAGNPQVAMDNNGNAIVVWWQSDGSDEQVFKSEYRGGGVDPSNKPS